MLFLSAAYLFYKYAPKLNYLLLIFFVVISINIPTDNEHIHLLSILAIIGAAIGFTFKKNKSFQFYVILTSISLTCMFTMNFFYLDKVENINILERSKVSFIEIIEKSPDVPDNEKKLLIDNVNDSVKKIKDIFLFANFLMLLLFALCCFFITKFLLTQRNSDEIKIKGIEYFKINDFIIFALITGWLIVLLIDNENYYDIYFISLNAGLILSAFYLIQSFGIIKFLLLKKDLPTFLLPLSIITIMIVHIESLIYILILLTSLGALDFWANFRKYGNKTENRLK